MREFASHTFIVVGLIEKPGEKFLQREAMPFYAVRAEAITQPGAAISIIKRSNSETEKISLTDPKSDDVLTFTGDIVGGNQIDAVLRRTTQSKLEIKPDIGFLNI